MRFIALVKFRRRLSRDDIAANLRGIEAETNEGVRYLEIFWTLGRYDAVVLFEAPDEKAAMRTSLHRADWAQTETLVAVPAVEARQLVE